MLDYRVHSSNIWRFGSIVLTYFVVSLLIVLFIYCVWIAGLNVWVEGSELVTANIDYFIDWSNYRLGFGVWKAFFIIIWMFHKKWHLIFVSARFFFWAGYVHCESVPRQFLLRLQAQLCALFSLSHWNYILDSYGGTGTNFLYQQPSWKMMKLLFSAISQESFSLRNFFLWTFNKLVYMNYNIKQNKWIF